MMTYLDVEILAFEDENNAVYCRECASKTWSSVLVEKCEAGLDDRLKPLPRWLTEDMAQERLEEERRHGYTSSSVTCDECGKTLANTT